MPSTSNKAIVLPMSIVEDKRIWQVIKLRTRKLKVINHQSTVGPRAASSKDSQSDRRAADSLPAGSGAGHTARLSVTTGVHHVQDGIGSLPVVRFFRAFSLDWHSYAYSVSSAGSRHDVSIWGIYTQMSLAIHVDFADF